MNIFHALTVIVWCPGSKPYKYCCISPALGSVNEGEKLLVKSITPEPLSMRASILWPMPSPVALIAVVSHILTSSSGLRATTSPDLNNLLSMAMVIVGPTVTGETVASMSLMIILSKSPLANLLVLSTAYM